MKRLKKWLIERFFPAVAKVEIESLREENAKLRSEIVRLNAYLDGMTDGVRAQRRVIIKNEVAK